MLLMLSRQHSRFLTSYWYLPGQHRSHCIGRQQFLQPIHAHSTRLLKVSFVLVSLHFGGNKTKMDEVGIKQLKSLMLIEENSPLRETTETRGR